MVLLHSWYLPPNSNIARSPLTRAAALHHAHSSDKLKVRIILATKKPSEILVRSRSNFYSVSTNWFALKAYQSTFAYDLLARYSLAFSLVLIALVFRLQSSKLQILTLVGISLAVHLRFFNFFYLDDMLILERMFQSGFKHLVQPQNEHFIPAFLAIFSGQFLIIGEFYTLYVVFACVLNGIVARIFGEFSKTLLSTQAVNRGAPFMLSMLFASSGFHAEIIQWLTSSCTIWANATRLLSMLFLWRGCSRNSTRDMITALGFASLGPLLFGGMFSLPIELLALTIVYFLSNPTSLRNSRALVRKVSLKFYLPLFIIYAIEALLYFQFRGSDGITSLSVVESPNPLVVARYVLLGSQFGAIARTLGLSDAVLLSDLQKSIFEQFSKGLGIPLDTAISTMGIVVSLSIGAIYAFSNERKKNVAIFFLGQVLACLPFVMSAAVRSKFGYEYALHLRYYSVAIIGVLIALIPAINMIASRYCRFSSRSRTVTVFVAGVVALHITANGIGISDRYELLQRTGQRDRVFFAQLVDWNQTLVRTPFVSSVGYEGIGTPFAGLQPLNYWGAPLLPSSTEPPPRHPDKTWAYIKGQFQLGVD